MDDCKKLILSSLLCTFDDEVMMCDICTPLFRLVKPIGEILYNGDTALLNSLVDNWRINSKGVLEINL